MEQDTNVTQAVEETEIVFDIADIAGAQEDASESETATAAETATQTAEAKSGTPTQTAEAEDEGVEITYLGEKRKLTKDELINLAQKGMNYDHINEQLTGYKGNKLLRAAQESAKNAGLSDDEFAEKLLGQINDREIQKIAKERNIPEEAARAIYEGDKAHKKEMDEANTQKAAQDAELEELREYKRVETLKENARREWREFTSAHPEIKSMDDFCPEAKEAIKQGRDLETAYTIHRNKQLETRIAEMEAAAKSPGSARSELAADDAEMDNFLRGFTGNW